MVAIVLPPTCTCIMFPLPVPETRSSRGADSNPTVVYAPCSVDGECFYNIFCGSISSHDKFLLFRRKGTASKLALRGGGGGGGATQKQPPKPAPFEPRTRNSSRDSLVSRSCPCSWYEFDRRPSMWSSSSIQSLRAHTHTHMRPRCWSGERPNQPISPPLPPPPPPSAARGRASSPPQDANMRHTGSRQTEGKLVMSRATSAGKCRPECWFQ